MAASAKEKFLTLLYDEILKLDLAELDFGLYRILKYRRDEIRAFFDRRLPVLMAEAVGTTRQDRLAEVVRRLAAQREKLDKSAQALGLIGAFAEDGAVLPALAATPVAEEYRQLSEEHRRLAVDAGFTQSEEERLYNHLYLFFSRYYQDGDFIPQPRRGRGGRYSVAYSGEDIHFHWRGRGSHYVKTTETLRSYSFRDGDWGVEFVLREATEAQNNVKGRTRYFFPDTAGLTVDDDRRRCTLPFAFRPPTAEDRVAEQANGGAVQDAISDAALARLRGKLPLGVDPERLAKHVRRYARKHRTDYFVNPALGPFLNEELDNYLKNEFLDVEGFASPEAMTDKFIKFRALRGIGREIIKFLDQVETFQARLFEKRKFVLRADYLVPVRLANRALWPEILKNKAQLAVWRELFALDGEVTEKTLEERSTLVVDTRHFDERFKYRLLAGFEDIDEALDGVLVHSENYAALRTLEAKYRGKVKCIYIDPPYNTGSDEFLYKDDFSRHSTWLTMMEERLRMGRSLLARDGVLFVSIDDNEQAALKHLLDLEFGEENFIATVIWQKVYSPKNTAKHFSEDHDFILAYAPDADGWRPHLLPRTEAMEGRYANPDNDPRGPWKAGDLSARNYYSEGTYAITCPSGRVIPGPPAGTYWRVSPIKFRELDADKRIWWGENGDNVPAIKRFLSETKGGVVPQTLWRYQDVGHTQDAKKELIGFVRFLRSEDVLNTVKPTKLLRRILQVGTEPEKPAHVMDFFAGSGSFGHEVIDQNRDDGGERRFVLVEMGDYFEGIIYQRIVGAMYAPAWKDGRPAADPDFSGDWVQRSPRLVKVLRLESYEDSLNALELPEERAARLQGMKDLFGDDYLLKYMLDFETEGSPVLLNTERLGRPFDYRLRIYTPDGLTEIPVDLVETFNLLMGFHVRRIYELRDAQRRYVLVEALEEHRLVLVVWRDATNLDPAREWQFLAERFRLADYDTVYVNADSALPNGRSLDAEFHRRMNERDRAAAGQSTPLGVPSPLAGEG